MKESVFLTKRERDRKVSSRKKREPMDYKKKSLCRRDDLVKGEIFGRKQTEETKSSHSQRAKVNDDQSIPNNKNEKKIKEREKI